MIGEAGRLGSESGTRWMPGCNAKEAVQLYPADLGWWGGILNNPQPQSEPYEKPASPDTLLPLYHLRFCLISELSLHGDAVAAAAQTL